MSEMNWTTSQILIVAGLVLQGLSVLYQARKYLNFLKSKEEKEMDYSKDEKWTKITKKISKTEKEWLVTILLIFIGLILQGIAEFIR
jgi:hypothetical protein